jgi:hypothetical protein
VDRYCTIQLYDTKITEARLDIHAELNPHAVLPYEVKSLVNYVVAPTVLLP